MNYCYNNEEQIETSITIPAENLGLSDVEIKSAKTDLRSGQITIRVLRKEEI
ncbi:hypothetical protein [Legionella sainthelensi]|uniref:hypothetical protein n=1 Tax=Legionella sainthelensi TaxID=28087 RepID=UPI00135B5519|nr:hypothetical protein [Legionella sainthelensi]